MPVTSPPRLLRMAPVVALNCGLVNALTKVVSTQDGYVLIRARVPPGPQVLGCPEMNARHHANYLPLLTSADHGLVTQAERTRNRGSANNKSQHLARTPFGRASLSRALSRTGALGRERQTISLGDAVCRSGTATNTASDAAWEYTFC